MRIKNWTKFQHYKDRNPPWLKLHKSLLDDMTFMTMSVKARAALPMLWLMASESDGEINPDSVQWRLRTKDAIPLDELIEAGFLEHGSPEEREKWPSRYIPAKVRQEMLCDGATCVSCGSSDRLEIDHIVPVSKGGTSDRKNLQVLCRSCNRRKHAKDSQVERSELLRSSAAEPESERSPEERQKAETEAKTEGERAGKPLDLIPCPSCTRTGHLKKSPGKNGHAPGWWCDKRGGCGMDFALDTRRILAALTPHAREAIEQEIGRLPGKRRSGFDQTEPDAAEAALEAHAGAWIEAQRFPWFASREEIALVSEDAPEDIRERVAMILFARNPHLRDEPKGPEVAA